MTNNPVRGRFNAWLLDLLDEYMHAELGAVKARLLRDLPATVVELGPGSGANLRYLPRGTRVIAIEPNVYVHDRLRRRAAEFGLDLELRADLAEALDLETAAVTFVYSSLVLCSVTDPVRVVAEVRRVLAPGGRFVCLEHVRAPRTSRLAALQRTIRRPWRWVFEGCDVCNRTEAVLRDAGFREIEIEAFQLPPSFVPVRHLIAAVCRA